MKFGRRSILSIFSIVAAVTIANEGLGAAGEASESSYDDRKFHIALKGCEAGPVAHCVIVVISKVRSAWDFSKENHLVTRSGQKIPATSMVVGGDELSVPSRATASLDQGVSTTIDIKYGRSVLGCDIQAVVVYVGHWSAKTVTLVPFSKKPTC